MPRRKKMRSSWGTVEDCGDGRHRLRWLEWHGGKRKRVSKTMRCPRYIADRELARLRTIYDHPCDMAMCPDFERCWEEWYIPDCQKRIEEGSLRLQSLQIYTCVWQKHVHPRWASEQMDEVKPAEWQEWLLTLPPSAAAIASVIAKNLVQCARIRGVRGIEFCEVSYRMPKAKTCATPTKEIYTLDEMVKIADIVRGSICEVPMLLMAFGSCRTGEACAPKLSDFRMDHSYGEPVAVVQINKQLTPHKAQILAPKTGTSGRAVVVPHPWSERLEQIAEKHRADNLIWLNDDGTGKPVLRFRINKTWNSLIKSSGLEVLPMSKLRKSWETMMRWKLGVDKDKVDKMMGHTSLDVRAKYYDRPDEEVFIETVYKAWENYKLS